ncbi:tetratricopeptide repeat protein, partial [Candidatus Zixiibacteriota bacterium]
MHADKQRGMRIDWRNGDPGLGFISHAGTIFLTLLMLLTVVPVAGQESSSELAFARKLYDDGLYLLAADQYRDFVLRNPTSSLADQARFMVGESFFAQNDLAQAGEAYRELLAEHPQSPFVSQAWYRLGSCLRQTGSYSEAAEALAQARGLEADASWADQALFEMADALRQAGEPDRALEAFDAMAKEYPQSSSMDQAHMARGEILVDIGRLSLARAAFQMAERTAVDAGAKAEARYRESKVLAMLGNESEAMALLSQLLEGEWQSIYADSGLFFLGNLRLDHGMYKQAAEVFAELGSRDRDDDLAENAELRRATALRLARDYRGASSVYRDWLVRYPRSQRAPQAKLELANCLRALGEMDSAVMVLEELSREIEDAQQEPRVWQDLGDALREMGKFDRALSAYREALDQYAQTAPADSLLLLTARILELDLKRPQAALRVYRSLPTQYPQSSYNDDAAFAQGRCHQASGEDQEALRAYRIFAQEYPLSSLYPLAQTKISYLSRYKVPEEPLALEAMVNLQDQLAADSLSAQEMDLRLAEIYFRHLKNYSRAASALERYLQKHAGSPLAEEALFQLAECHRAMAEMAEMEGDTQAAVEARRKLAGTCRQLLMDFPGSPWADRCALEVIADVLRNSDSQGDDYWADQLGLYDSFVHTYLQSAWRGFAYLRMAEAQTELTGDEGLALGKADSLLVIIGQTDRQGTWADTAAARRIQIARRRG